MTATESTPTVAQANPTPRAGSPASHGTNSATRDRESAIKRTDAEQPDHGCHLPARFGIAAPHENRGRGERPQAQDDDLGRREQDRG